MITKTIKETPSVLMLFWENFSTAKDFPDEATFVRFAMSDSEKSINYFTDIFSKFDISMDVNSKEDYDALVHNFKEINSKYIRETQILNSIETAFESESNMQRKYSLGIFITKLNVKETPPQYKLDTPPLYEIFLKIEDSDNGIRFNMDKISISYDNIEHNFIPVAFLKDKSGDDIIFAEPDKNLLEKILSVKDKIDIFSQTNQSFKFMHDFVSKVAETYANYGVITTPHLKLFNLINTSAENYK